MALNIIAEFFKLIDIGLFDAASVLLIIGFLVWEIPRSFEVMPEEYTKGLYPEHGRVVDFALLAVGLLAIVFFSLKGTDIVKFMKTPGVTSYFLVLMLVVPLIIVLSFLRKFASKLDKYESISIFLAQGFLDLMHTLFYLGLCMLVIPAAGFLIFGK